MNIKTYETIELQTERLVLKKGSIEDYVSVYEYDMRKVRDIAGEFKLEKQDPNEIKAWFKNGIDEYYSDCMIIKQAYDWIVYLKNEMIPIGNIIADRPREELSAIELAFNLHPNYWGNGYMPEAITETLNYLFKIGYENVIMGYDEGNIKSKRVCEKLGFQQFELKNSNWIKNGVTINTYILIMNKEDWYNKNNVLKKI
jgi:[ribosomal protein S5]-alanine N-acetyltransferase